MADGRRPAVSDCSLAILARAPEPGRAKTRIVPRLGPEGAAELHALLVRRTVRTALASGVPRTTLWCTPGRNHPFFAEFPERGSFDRRDQPQGDLGVRMHAALETHLGAGGTALLIGTDSPGLAGTHLQAARRALDEGAPAVFLPAEDGGYALVGLSRIDHSLFDGVPWGTSRVMATTRERVRSLGWVAAELPPVRDVDRPEDVDWLLDSGLLDPEEQARLEALLRAPSRGPALPGAAPRRVGD